LSPVTPDQEIEAAHLAELIAPRAGELVSVKLGKRFTLQSAEFRLHAHDRNAVYRVRGRFDWFLKLLPLANRGLVERERLGADLCRKVLGARSDFNGPFVTRVSIDPPYVLSAAVPGVPVTRALSREAWSIRPSNQTEKTFAAIGGLLATLHAARDVPVTAPHTTKYPFEIVRKLLQRIPGDDAVIEEIRSWLGERGEEYTDRTFVHGNLRLDNLLVDDGRVGFVDFESAGIGPSYQDTSRPVTQLLLLDASIGVSKRRVARLLDAFLSAYRAVRPCELDELSEWVAIRLARYYVESHGRRLPGTIGGLPVVRPRLAATTTDLMRRGGAGLVSLVASAT
jgi:aminoglycoside phosphotransferase